MEWLQGLRVGHMEQLVYEQGAEQALTNRVIVQFIDRLIEEVPNEIDGAMNYIKSEHEPAGSNGSAYMAPDSVSAESEG